MRGCGERRERASRATFVASEARELPRLLRVAGERIGTAKRAAFNRHHATAKRAPDDDKQSERSTLCARTSLVVGVYAGHWVTHSAGRVAVLAPSDSIRRHSRKRRTPPRPSAEVRARLCEHKQVRGVGSLNRSCAGSCTRLRRCVRRGAAVAHSPPCSSTRPPCRSS